MKTADQLLKFACIPILCGLLITNCKKNDGEPENPGGPGSSVTTETISNQLLFFNATKTQGTIPRGPAGSSLKISFDDTLYLMDKIKRPIKFLHEDTTKNVAGIYVQVHATVGGTGGSVASYYYDAPEIPDLADNDTVSVIMIGVDPAGLIDPARGGTPLVFDMTITPYDKSGQPLAEAIRSVKISKQKIDPDGNTGLCGLVLPPLGYWDWDLSLVENPSNGTLFFYNDPDKVWGGGQFITGCCINGVSSYNTVLNCENDPTKASRKFFPTYFQHLESATKFFNNGTYSHFSRQINVNPNPTGTNFCGVTQGAVDVSSRTVTAEGTWKITKSTPFKGDSLRLSLFQTKSNGVGLVNPGGFIHQLDCNVLVLIKPDQEGGSNDLVSFYTRIDPTKDGWFAFN
jgi:hypothetical protein